MAKSERAGATWSNEARAGYIQVQKEGTKVANTLPEWGQVYVDVDAFGEIIGIEVLVDPIPGKVRTP